MEQKTKNLIAKITWAVIIAGIVAGLIYLSARQDCSGNQGGPGTPTDTVVDTIKIDSIIRDTVLEWREKIVWKEVKPETVTISPDTIRVDTVWEEWPEGIIHLEKKNDMLTFVSIAPGDTLFEKGLLKRYSYIVGNTFTITSKGDGFFVKIHRGFWENFYGGAAAGFEFKVWGDSTMAFADPYVRAFLGWGPVNLGPEIGIHGISIRAEASWRF